MRRFTSSLDAPTARGYERRVAVRRVRLGRAIAAHPDRTLGA